MTTLTLSRARFDLGFAKAMSKIGRILGSIAAAQQAASDFDRLNNRTDAELAAKGLRRTDVARVVFERHYE